MDNKNLQYRLIHLFEDVFDLSDVRDKSEISKATIEDWDSIGQIRLIFALEEEFNITIPMENGVQFDSLERILEYISKVLEQVG